MSKGHIVLVVFCLLWPVITFFIGVWIETPPSENVDIELLLTEQEPHFSEHVDAAAVWIADNYSQHVIEDVTKILEYRKEQKRHTLDGIDKRLQNLESGKGELNAPPISSSTVSIFSDQTCPLTAPTMFVSPVTFRCPIRIQPEGGSDE